MKQVACSRIKSTIDALAEVYVLVVSEHCHYCKDILDKFTTLGLKRETIVVNQDRCGAELDSLIKFDSYPIIVHFKAGREVRRGTGVAEIESFDQAPTTRQAA